MSAPGGLARKSVGTPSLWFFAVGASSPMTVLAGGVIATYAGTGVVGVPLSFLLVAGALALLTVGYVAMSRHVAHAATCYALLAHGLGRSVGVAGAAVALVAYNAIQISLYGLVGVILAGELGGDWWRWAAVVWVAVTVVGLLRVTINARVLALALIAELGVITLLDLGALTHASSGISFEPLSPDNLFVNGVGGVLALGMAAFVGYESGPVFSEEARGPRTVARATFAALAFLGLFYAFSSWALAMAFGPANVVDAARELGAGLPFAVLESSFGPAYGPMLSQLATVLLVTSIFAAMLSFHNGVARYVFALGRERVLPPALARTGSGARGGAPIGGSLFQSITAALVVTAYAVIGADPFTGLFTWLSTIGAVGVLVLLLSASVAALRYFRSGGGTNEGPWVRVIAPTLGVAAGMVVLATTVSNVESLLGLPPGSPRAWIIPGIIGAAALGGLAWGAMLRASRPEVYAGIGRGRPHPLAVLDQRLAEVEV
ncbi:MAG TPA: APC family permease [Actinomycetes bacterium]|nr:APC family permease [Actinomycetes bacterium]